MHRVILELADASATERAGRLLAPTLTPGFVVTLSGDLGAWKTTLVRGVLRGMDIRGPVKSPTYTLVEPYAVSSLYLYHFDFYRLKDPEEWEAAGFREYFGKHAICLVEWPEKARGLLPHADLELALQITEPGRALTATALTERAEPCIDALSRLTSGAAPPPSSASSAGGSSAG
jgi:tRNA threonylcarbamoyladenosine biosynthesis protein TsaE